VAIPSEISKVTTHSFTAVQFVLPPGKAVSVGRPPLHLHRMLQVGQNDSLWVDRSIYLSIRQARNFLWTTRLFPVRTLLLQKTNPLGQQFLSEGLDDIALKKTSQSIQHDEAYQPDIFLKADPSITSSSLDDIFFSLGAQDRPDFIGKTDPSIKHFLSRLALCFRCARPTRFLFPRPTNQP